MNFPLKNDSVKSQKAGGFDLRLSCSPCEVVRTVCCPSRHGVHIAPPSPAPITMSDDEGNESERDYKVSGSSSYVWRVH